MMTSIRTNHAIETSSAEDMVTERTRIWSGEHVGPDQYRARFAQSAADRRHVLRQDREHAKRRGDAREVTRLNYLLAALEDNPAAYLRQVGLSLPAERKDAGDA